jgi:hypothetical protein
MTLKMIEEVVWTSCISYDLEDDRRGGFDKLYLLTLKMIEEGDFFWHVGIHYILEDDHT